MSSNSKSREGSGTDAPSQEAPTERAPVRANFEDDDIDEHLTLANSGFVVKPSYRPKNNEYEEEQAKPVKEVREPPREAYAAADKRQRSKSKNSRQYPPQSRMGQLNWRPSQKRVKLPQLDDDDADDEDDKRRDGKSNGSRGARSRSNSKTAPAGHGASLTEGERILQEELLRAAAEQSAPVGENQRQRRQRMQARKRRSSRHYVRESSSDESSDSDSDPDTSTDATIARFQTQSQNSATAVEDVGQSPANQRKGAQNYPNNHNNHHREQYRRKEDQTDKNRSTPSPPPPSSEAAPTKATEKTSSNTKTEVKADSKHKGDDEKQKVEFPEPPPNPTHWRQIDPNSELARVLSSDRTQPQAKSLDDLLKEQEMKTALSRSSSGINGPKPEDLGDIEKVSGYIEDTKVAMEEDAEHEFKAIQNSTQPLERIIAYCRKYIVSFLNADGGVIYFGVEDDGTVKGVPFSRRGRDLLRLGIDQTVSNIKPQVDTDLIKVILVPVERNPRNLRREQSNPAIDRKSGNEGANNANEGDKKTGGGGSSMARSGDETTNRFVVEVHVGRGNAPVYLTQDGTAFFRRSGSVYRMDAELVQRRIERGRPIFAGDMPQVPREFIGREKELELIREYVLNKQNSKYALVLLHGLPMTGKSTLARQLVDTWASLWPDAQFMADLKGASRHYVHNIEAQVSVIRAVYPILQLPETKEEINGLYRSCFTGKRAILLLENVGRVDQIKDLLTPAIASAKSVLVIVTSRRDLPIEVDLDGVSVRLAALELNAAVKLLKTIVGTRGPKFSDEIAQQLVQLAGCMPLPIRMLAANVARMNNACAIDDLINTAKADDTKRTELLFGKLAAPFDLNEVHSSELVRNATISGDDKPQKSENDENAGDPTSTSSDASTSPATNAKNAQSPKIGEAGSSSTATTEDGVDERPPLNYLLSLSVFPANFDLLAVSYLWGTSHKETGSILQSLVESNEIDISSDKLRFSQNDLFKSWCQTKAFEAYGEEGMLKWKTIFCEYYFSLMDRCFEFFCRGLVRQGLELLANEAANFERTILYAPIIDKANNTWEMSTKALVAVNRLNAYFGSGEQRKWDKIKQPLVEIPEVVALADKELITCPIYTQKIRRSSSSSSLDASAAAAIAAAQAESKVPEPAAQTPEAKPSPVATDSKANNEKIEAKEVKSEVKEETKTEKK